MGKRLVQRNKVGVCYLYKACVSGSGPFPWDMLRYDGCYPASEHDVFHMVGVKQEVDRTTYEDLKPVTRHVNLICVTTARISTPFTRKKWESFGWTLTPL